MAAKAFSDNLLCCFREGSYQVTWFCQKPNKKTANHGMRAGCGFMPARGKYGERSHLN
jgi:hypothetical protein